MPLSPELAARRKADRATLLARRVAAPAADHARWSSAIEAHLREALGAITGWTVGFCWPFQAEFDARPFVRDLRRRGSRAALPVVVGKGEPLEFHEWWPGVAMVNGVYDVPIPDGTARLAPDLLLIPAVGIGSAGDRLGYGGGFFDRTLAARTPRPVSIAIAFELSRLPTTEPQAHDVLMDLVVTESGWEVAEGGRLVRVTAADAAARVAAIAAERGVPQRSNAMPKVS
jgi:5-formyltetrahydrofolate cyclo-ligase